MKSLCVFLVGIFLTCALFASNVPVYVYTDFGGGQSVEPISDWQTAVELSNLAWKRTQRPELLINDSAKPLDPAAAGADLAATFPYVGPAEGLKSIVVHVIDPGVGNEQGTAGGHPRSLVLRKDGVLFIGPDNGTLSQAVPDDSVASIWEIDPQAVSAITGTDLEAGGTFHGRDLFTESALLIAAGLVEPYEIGRPYPELKNRSGSQLEFQALRTDRWDLSPEGDPFALAFWLNVVQSPIEQTKSKTLYALPDPSIAIVNKATGNIYVGPDNGVGTALFLGYDPALIHVTRPTKAVLEQLVKEPNTQKIHDRLLAEKESHLAPQQIDLGLSGETAKGRIWIDAYGNIKTTLTSQRLAELVAAYGPALDVQIGDVSQPAIVAQSFSEVPEGQLFVYAGSSAAPGANPDRANRLVEVTANGAYGKFGADFFDHPKAGDTITFKFGGHSET